MSSMAFAGPQRPIATTKARDGALTSGVILSLSLHAAALTGIFALAHSPPVAPSIPIMVSVITAPTPEPIKPEPAQELPKPRPIRTKPLPPLPQPLLAAKPQETAPAEAAAPAPQPPPPVAAPAEAAPAPAAPVIVPPRFDAAYLDNPAPPYPPMSRRMGEQGKVLLRVLVNADGSAAQVQLKNTSGSSRLDQSALDTVKRWRFVPAKQGTEAVSAWVQVPISFTLGG